MSAAGRARRRRCRSRSGSRPTPAPPHGTPVLRASSDPAIVESSGLVVADGLFVTTNDSGDTGRVFVVDPADGRTVGVTHWSDDPTDVEALAPAGRGARSGSATSATTRARATVTITRVPVGRATARVAATSYRLAYPDGAARRRDPARATRSPAGSTSPPRTSSAARCTPSRATCSATATNRLHADRPRAADRHRRRVLPRRDGTWSCATTARPSVYAWPVAAAGRHLRLPAQRQGEGIAVAATGRSTSRPEGAARPGAPDRPARRRTTGDGRTTGPTSSRPADPRPPRRRRRTTRRRRIFSPSAGGGLLALLALVALGGHASALIHPPLSRVVDASAEVRTVRAAARRRAATPDERQTILDAPCPACSRVLGLALPGPALRCR